MLEQDTEFELDNALRRARLIREEWKATQRRAEALAVLLGLVIVGCLIASVFLLDEPQASGLYVGAAVSIVGGLIAGAISGVAVLLSARRVRDSRLSPEAVFVSPLAHVLIAPLGSLAVYLFTTTFLPPAVFGIPDDEMGQSVKGVVQTVDPADATDDFGDELMGWLRERLAHYKCPRSVSFEAQLPRTDTGKLYKQELIKKYS